MADTFDFKKEYKDLYAPKAQPMVLDVPRMRFFMMDGSGDPNGPEYHHAVECLYAVSYAVKMSKMGDKQPEGYFPYVVPPLEGLWWCDGASFDFHKRDDWRWTSMIRQPEFVDEAVLAWAKTECQRKKPDLDVGKVRFETFEEGLCVQMLHLGPYATEPESVAIMHQHLKENCLRDETGLARKHHEIYLSDPRKTAPDKYKTVLRHPVARV